jgi:hypothetical protein
MLTEVFLGMARKKRRKLLHQTLAESLTETAMFSEAHLQH